MITRRNLLLGAAAAALPKAPLVDTHVHLFAADRERFPLHPNAPYRNAAPVTVEGYGKFAKQAGVDHAIIVHPEPYQDDHRYLEYCFAHEPAKNFFKGTCLFDPIATDTPARIARLMQRNPGRIVALRIHEVHEPGSPPATSGAIKDRDLRSSAMRNTWRKVHEMGLAVQMHFLPYYAPQIEALAAQFPEMPVLLDHLARGWQGTPAEFDGVLRLAKLPRVYLKYSEINGARVQPLVRRAFDAFGPNRMMWGSFGHDLATFNKKLAEFEAAFAFASAADRDRIRGGNAMDLFRFS